MGYSSELHIHYQEEQLYKTAYMTARPGVATSSAGFIGKQVASCYRAQDMITSTQSAMARLSAYRKQIADARACESEDTLQRSEAFRHLLANAENAKVELQCQISGLAEHIGLMHRAILDEQYAVLNTPLIPNSSNPTA